MMNVLKKLGTHLVGFAHKTIIFSKKHLIHITLILAVIAVGLSGYNTYLIKNAKVTGKLTPTVKFAKLTTAEIEKLIKDGAPVLGNMDAKVTVVEFGDFQCPYCGKYFKQILPEIREKYIKTGKVRFIYMSFAFLGQESQDSAQAAKCAQDQGKFWEYHDYIYNNQQGENRGAFSPENLKAFAIKLGLSSAQFNKCLDEKKYEKYITNEVQVGRKFGVKGTPATFINDFFIDGLQDVSYFRNRIEAELAGK